MPTTKFDVNGSLTNKDSIQTINDRLVKQFGLDDISGDVYTAIGNLNNTVTSNNNASVIKFTAITDRLDITETETTSNSTAITLLNADKTFVGSVDNKIDAFETKLMDGATDINLDSIREIAEAIKSDSTLLDAVNTLSTNNKTTYDLLFESVFGADSLSTTVNASLDTKLTKGSNLSDLSDVNIARINLGLGDTDIKNSVNTSVYTHRSYMGMVTTKNVTDTAGNPYTLQVLEFKKVGTASGSNTFTIKDANGNTPTIADINDGAGTAEVTVVTSVTGSSDKKVTINRVALSKTVTVTDPTGNPFTFGLSENDTVNGLTDYLFVNNDLSNPNEFVGGTINLTVGGVGYSDKAYGPVSAI